ncbi:MAG: DUF4082 domain-containing protein, partial [Saprospiraceae bacterium]|nr:DUF4082 domain-containing protein [Saprospiraceae bacterium]
MKKIFTFLILILGFLNLQAQDPGVENLTGCGGFLNNDWSLGWAFTPTEDIEVTALGVYDFSNNGLNSDHPVGLYDGATQALLASTTVPAGTGATLISGFRYVDLASPVVLTAGNTYVVAAVHLLTGGDLYGSFCNSGTFNYVNYISDRFIQSSTLQYPPNVEGSALSLFGGNFLSRPALTIACPPDTTVDCDSPMGPESLGEAKVTTAPQCGENGRQLFSYSGTIETWTVPEGVCFINVTANGAQGGNEFTNTGGQGAVMSGRFAVTPGQVLEILVGQQGQTNPCGATGGGGGGTFVVDQATGDPLIVAGGGGGATINFGGVDASTTQNGTADSGGWGTGGSGGSGGSPCRTDSWPNGGGGGGFSGNGASTSSSGRTTGGGFAYINGGAGGTTSPTQYADGGFGGGGAANSCTVGGGGGGGYSGGAGGWHSFADVGTLCGPVYLNTRFGGGGGGSFNSGTNATASVGNTGNGSVLISYTLPLETTYTDVIVPGSCPNEYTIERTFSVFDFCEREASCTQIITVQDTTLPMVMAPADTTINCEDTCHLTPIGGGAGGAAAVAVLGSPNSPAWNTEVQDKLIASGAFSVVDAYLINNVTPTLAQLMQYDAVLVYSNGAGYQNSTQLGNNLADYVDAGGGVVTAVFANASIPFGGRFNSDNYWCIQPASQSQGVVLTLGTVHEPGSPLMVGVNSFNGGSSSYRSTGSVHPMATRVADYNNGSPLIVRREINGTNRVGLNFFPPSNDSRGDFWLASTDGVQIMVNALNFTGGATGPCTGTATVTDNCTGVGPLASGNPTLTLTGVDPGNWCALTYNPNENRYYGARAGNAGFDIHCWN